MLKKVSILLLMLFIPAINLMSPKQVNKFLYAEVRPITLNLFNPQPKIKYPPDVTKKNFAEFIRFKNRNKYLKDKNITRIVHVIFEQSEKYKFDPLTILAIMGVESTYWYRAKGPQKEKGLMQVHPDWLKGRNNLIDAGILKKESELFYIGRGVQAGLYVLNKKRNICLNFYSKKILAKMGYKTINECIIRRYNGSRNRPYYTKVASYIGDYYFFVRKYNNIEKQD